MNAVQVSRAKIWNENCTTCRFVGCRFSIVKVNSNEYYCSHGVLDPNDTSSYFQIQRQVYVTNVCEHYVFRLFRKIRGPRQVRCL